MMFVAAGLVSLMMLLTWLWFALVWVAVAGGCAVVPVVEGTQALLRRLALPRPVRWLAVLRRLGRKPVSS
jgi:hypothetical protein